VSRALVVGSSGLLGRALIRRVGPSATGTGRTRLGGGRLALDARDPEAVLRAARQARPDVVVNLVAERRPAHWADPDALRAVNVATAAHVAAAARSLGADMVHISTDYVFPSGGPFPVDAPHAPTNAYGATKSEAESVVRHAHGEAVIVRMPVLYGRVEHPAECNLSQLVHRLASAREPVALDTWAQRRPTHVDDVAETLARLIDAVEPWRGLTVHVSATGWHSQFEMGQLAAELLGLDPALLAPAFNASPGRPRRVELRLDDETPYLSGYRPLEEGLAQLVEGYAAHE
jgi:dTDP-4-dehydrorhamnose reductase